YELLTGRPPFKAENAMETLSQVLHKEPVPPRKLQAGIDADLETICLKCLEKDPWARYLSADDLAKDLDNWLAGEPIAARPAGTMERAVKWVRRRPAAAALAGLSAALMVGLVVFLAVQLEHAEARAKMVQNVEAAKKKVEEMEDKA